MEVRDLLFERTFSSLFVYNILFEDAEVDERFFGLDERSKVLCISGAGCGVAGMLAKHPKSIDAIDINPHHLALSALKVSGSRSARPYGEFYDLLGRGWLPDPDPVIRALTTELPAWIRLYWRQNKGMFRRSLYRAGLTSRLVAELRKRSGIDVEWLERLMAAPIEARRRMIDTAITPVFESRTARWLTRSPLQLLALGVNYQQNDRLLETEQQGLAEFFAHHVRRLADTDLRTNWFVWYFVTGQFNHEEPEGVPPYLRRDRYERSQEAPTDVRFERSNLFRRLARGESREWTHYSLLDAVDWLDERAEARLLGEIRRTGEEGAIVLHRSVGDDCLFDRHPEGRHFERLDAESDLATKLDRTRQYRRVSLHRLVS